MTRACTNGPRTVLDDQADFMACGFALGLALGVAIARAIGWL